MKFLAYSRPCQAREREGRGKEKIENRMKRKLKCKILSHSFLFAVFAPLKQRNLTIPKLLFLLSNVKAYTHLQCLGLPPLISLSFSPTSPKREGEEILASPGLEVILKENGLKVLIT